MGNHTLRIAVGATVGDYRPIARLDRMPTTARGRRTVTMTVRCLLPLLLILGLRAESTVAFLGDSLTAGYGLAEQQAFPALIAGKLAAAGLDWRVVNAGESGDTTKGGLSRLGWMLRSQPQVVVVALGGNDGLRGLEPERTKANLQAIIDRLQAAGAQVVLCGMMLPRNFGPDYTARFRALYGELAATNEVGFYPFLLAGVAADPALNQVDGIHPNAKGQAIIAERLFAFLEPLLKGEVAAEALVAAAPASEETAVE